MRVDGSLYRTIFLAPDETSVDVIDQTKLPYEFAIRRLRSVDDAVDAIRVMTVRGAPLIGATAAYGIAMATRVDASDAGIEAASRALLSSRPTAVNLRWAVEVMKAALAQTPIGERIQAAYRVAGEICDADVRDCRQIGINGAALIVKRNGEDEPIHVLTHCNAGWLATVDWGTALAPIYRAHEMGVSVHVWVDETRPRNQGAALTAWELARHGIPHTVVVDNAGGHLMQTGRVDLCIVGSDRTAANGDVCNKIGTYLKALAAHDNNVPFYVALPHSTIDWTLSTGDDIPIEERAGEEVSLIVGRGPNGEKTSVQITPEGSPVANPAFDVTPSRLVSALITERGCCPATREGLASLYPEKAKAAA